MFKEFKGFIMRGNVVDLAVGIVIGAAFAAIVTALVSGLINPIVALFGDSSLGDLSFAIGTTTNEAGDTVPNQFVYGGVLDAILNFVIVAAAIFFMVVRPINQIQARKAAGEPTPEATTRPCPACLEEISKKARRCSHCTEEVGVAA